MSISIRTLGSEDFDAFRKMRFEALATSPNSFFTLLQEEEGKGPEEYYQCFSDTANASNDCMFGLFDGERLIGLTGLTREPRTKRQHIAWIRSVYVTPEYRGRQFGKMLVQHAIDNARMVEGIQVLHLSVESGNTAAKNTYLSLGFTVWGVEHPAAIYNGVEYGEDYMSLRIK